MADQRVTFAELGRRLGRSPEELKAEAAQTPVIHDGPNESTLCKDVKLACLAPISQLLMGLREGCYALEGPKVKIIGVHRRDDNRQGDF